jgi:alpha/beta hydrolase fold
MPIAHNGHARSAFPFQGAPRDDAAMLAPMRTAPRDRLRAGRVADLQLRGWSGPLRARVTWPSAGDGSDAPALALCFPDGSDDHGRLARAVRDPGGVVVLSVGLRSAPHEPSPDAFHDAVAALEWAADHGAELDADPGRLIVAGERAGAAVAAAMALHARDNWWPAVARQVLVHPALDAWHPSVPYVSGLRYASLGGVAPATVVTGAAPATGGWGYAARLRRAGVEVDVVVDEP